jgi:RTX calcium-binding nonapeptide repeat (4 copies)
MTSSPLQGGRHRRSAAFAAVAALMLLAPAAASASVDVTLSGGTLHVTSGSLGSDIVLSDHYDASGSQWNGYKVGTYDQETITSSDASCAPDPNQYASDPQHNYVCLTMSPATLVQVDLGDGDDLLRADHIGNSSLDGTPAVPPAHFEGGEGNDDIQDGNGDDTVNGGPGNDLLDGDSNFSTFGQGHGNDTMNGGPGDDKIDGGYDNDTLTDTDGTDQLYGGFGDDTLDVGDGAGGDTAGCNEGTGDVATADAADTVYDCETVHEPSTHSEPGTQPQPQPGPQPQPQPGSTTVQANIGGAKAQSVGSQGGLIFTGSCPGGCTLFAQATVAVPKLSKVYRFKSKDVHIAAGATKTVKVKMSGKGLKAIKKALAKHKKLKAKVTFIAADGLGHTTPYKTTVKLKR